MQKRRRTEVVQGFLAKKNILQGIRANKYLLKAIAAFCYPELQISAVHACTVTPHVPGNIYSTDATVFFFTYPNTCTIERVFSTVCARCATRRKCLPNIDLLPQCSDQAFLFSPASLDCSSEYRRYRMRLTLTEYKSDSSTRNL